MFYNFSFFAKPSMDFIQLWRDDRALSIILCSTIPIPAHDLRSRSQTLNFFCVKSLHCQLLQSLWLIWIVFGMNGYKILKCFRKEKHVSGELPCPATGLIIFTNITNSQSCTKSSRGGVAIMIISWICQWSNIGENNVLTNNSVLTVLKIVSNPF